MGVNLGGGDTFMAQQGLNILQLYVFFQQPGGVSVAELMRRDLFVDASFVDQLL